MKKILCSILIISCAMAGETYANSERGGKSGHKKGAHEKSRHAGAHRKAEGRAGRERGRHYKGSRRGYHRGYYGGFGARAYGWAWTAAVINGVAYDYAIPQQAIVEVYKENYPYWGYDLGAGQTLDELARAHKWEEVKTQLRELRKKTAAQLRVEASKPKTDDKLITELKARLQKINLHVHGLQQKPGKKAE